MHVEPIVWTSDSWIGAAGPGPIRLEEGGPAVEELGIGLMFVGGFAALGACIHHLVRSAEFRKRGIHRSGVVVRHEVTSYPEGDVVMRAPVIEFVDEWGVRREFTSNMSNDRSKPALGESVPVAYLPGRPETARLYTARHTVAVLLATSSAAVVFLGGGLISVLSG